MSWGNAFRYLQRNIFEWTWDTKNINTLSAVLEAARDNTDIEVGDFVMEKGKPRPLKINYIPPTCDDDGDCTDSVCDTGRVIAPQQDWFEIKQCTASAVYQINKEDLRLVDGNYTFTDHGIQTIISVLPDVREKLSTDIAALLVAETGVLFEGQSSMAVDIMNPTTGGMAPSGFWQIQQEYIDSGYIKKAPYIIGGTQVFNWQKASEIASMNTVAGLDLGKLRPVGNLYYDKLIPNTYGDPTTDHIIGFSPDMIKFISYSKNAGIFATDVNNIQAINAMYQRGYPTLVNGGFVDPRTGLMWDLDIRFVECGEDNQPYWTFQIRLNWDIFFMPPRICNVQGVNSIFHFTTCLPQQPECGDNPYPSPAVPTSKSGSAAGLTYPLIVQKMAFVDADNNDINVFYNLSNDPVSLADTTALKDFLNEFQSQITFTNVTTTLHYTGITNIRLRINDTTTIAFS